MLSVMLSAKLSVRLSVRLSPKQGYKQGAKKGTMLSSKQGVLQRSRARHWQGIVKASLHDMVIFCYDGCGFDGFCPVLPCFDYHRDTKCGFFVTMVFSHVYLPHVECHAEC